MLTALSNTTARYPFERDPSGLIPEADALAYAVELLSGVEHVAECGYAHLDIKPDNLLVTAARGGVVGEIQILLGDFGTVTALSAAMDAAPNGATVPCVVFMLCIVCPIDMYGTRGFALDHCRGEVTSTWLCALLSIQALHPPALSHTQLTRAPEAMGDGCSNYGTDVWAAGCTLAMLISNMHGMLSAELVSRAALVDPFFYCVCRFVLFCCAWSGFTLLFAPPRDQALPATGWSTRRRTMTTWRPNCCLRLSRIVAPAPCFAPFSRLMRAIDRHRATPG